MLTTIARGGPAAVAPAVSADGSVEACAAFIGSLCLRLKQRK